MPRQLSSPIEGIDQDEQRVTTGAYVLKWSDGAIDINESYYQYTVTTYFADNTVSKSVNERVYAVDMPTAFRTKLRELHTMVISDAENKGLLLPGVDTDDL